jgi:hypothetical protein
MAVPVPKMEGFSDGHLGACFVLFFLYVARLCKQRHRHECTVYLNKEKQLLV